MAASITAVVKGAVVYLEDGRPAPAVEEFMPDDPEHFGVHLQAFLGAEARDPPDSFDVTVCSPSWLAEQLGGSRSGARRLRAHTPAVIPEAIIVGSGVWLMRRWDSSQVTEALRSLCQACSPGPDWGTVASRIGRTVPWEFAYRYDEHVNNHYGAPFPPPR